LKRIIWLFLLFFFLSDDYFSFTEPLFLASAGEEDGGGNAWGACR
jgi:hypothetical protein